MEWTAAIWYICCGYTKFKNQLQSLVFIVIMSPPEGLGDILFFPGRPDVRLSVRLSVCLSVTNRVRSVT